MNIPDSGFKKLLETYNKITVIGISPDASKPSHRIPVYMKNHGYEVVGVNPTADGDIAGIKMYKSLSDVPADFRKFVNVFRRPDAIPAVVDEVLKLGGAEVLWLQLGIEHDAAEKKAEAAGLKVVSNRCLYVEHKNYL